MNRINRGWGVLGLAAAGLLACFSTPALADKLHLKDGRVLEGTIEQETDTFVKFVIVSGGLKSTQIFARDEISKIEKEDRPAEGDSPEAAGIPGTPSANSDRTIEVPEGATKISFITYGDGSNGKDMIGPYIFAPKLKESIQYLYELPEKVRPDVVVLHCNSGGGALAEIHDLVDVIHDYSKPKFRTVGWIESAISAASMTIWACEELYTMAEGNIGGSVGYMMVGPGQAKAMEGEELEEVLDYMVTVSKKGGHEPLVMRAMQVFQELSCDIDEDGKVTWRGDLNGRYIVNPKDRILTLDAPQSVKYGICRSIADDKEALAKAMGCTEWVEVGRKADLIQVEFREAVHTAEARLGELQGKIDLAVAYAVNASTQDERGRQVGIARRYLNEIRSILRRAPSLAKYQGITKEALDDYDDRLRKLANPDA